MIIVAAFLLAGMALGAVDGALAQRGVASAGPLAALFGAALMGTLALLPGAVAAGGARLARRWTWLSARRARLRRLTDRGATERRPVVDAHAWVVAAVLAGGAMLALFHLLLRQMWMLDEDRFAIRLTTGIAIALFAGTLLAIPLLAAALRRPLARLDGRIRLPLPPQPELRWALWVAVPVCAGAIWFAVTERQLLGPGRAAFLWLIALVALAPALAGGLARVMRRSHRRQLAISGSTGALWFIALIATVLLWDGHPRDATAIDHTGGALAGASLVRRVSDVDRDGASGLLGGGDCAPFDGDRSPDARDLPGNGIDEDCSGADIPTDAVALYPRVRYSGALPGGLVRRWNILWLTLDAVRADHVGVYGYPRKTTPYLDALATDSLLYRNAFAQSSRTFFSVASMFAGLDPATMVWEQKKRYQQPASRHRMLAERLRDLGYRREMVLPGGMADEFDGLQQGYEQVHDYFLDSKWKKWREQAAPSAAIMTLRTIERLSANPEPWFVYTHFIDGHSPYNTHPGGYPDFGKTVLGNYDADIAYVDRHVGFLLEYLKHRPELAARTIVIVTADHGEEFGEHNQQFHGFTCHGQAVRVPLLLRVPGLEPARIEQPVGLVDLVPTVLELIGAGSGVDELHGQSLLTPALASGAADPQRPLFCLTSSASGRLFLRRSVRMGDLALFLDVHTGAYHLYDTARDHAEKRDLIDATPPGADLERMKAALAATMTGNAVQFW